MEAPHVAFGFGVHQCLGQHVARLLLGIALPRLFRRFPGLAVAEPEQELVLREDGPLFSVQSLPMVWDA
jgi:cytochrome P450